MDHTQYTTNKADRKPGKHLTREDRGAIEAMKKLGQSNRAIARYLNCSPTTVSNELKRGTRPKNGRSGRTPGYCAKCGMLVYQTHRANCHKPHSLRKGSPFAQWVVNQVRQGRNGRWMPVWATHESISCFCLRKWSSPRPCTMRYGQAIWCWSRWSFPRL